MQFFSGNLMTITQDKIGMFTQIFRSAIFAKTTLIRRFIDGQS